MLASWPTTLSTVITRPSIPHSEPYDLAELAEPIPGNWRRPGARGRTWQPHRAATATLFAALCKLALRCSNDGLLTWARILNREYSIPRCPRQRLWVLCGLCATTGHDGAFEGTKPTMAIGNRPHGGAGAV